MFYITILWQNRYLLLIETTKAHFYLQHWDMLLFPFMLAWLSNVWLINKTSSDLNFIYFTKKRHRNEVVWAENRWHSNRADPQYQMSVMKPKKRWWWWWWWELHCVKQLIPAVSGVLPTDMTAAITAWGGTAEEETHTVRTNHHVPNTSTYVCLSLHLLWI